MATVHECSLGLLLLAVIRGVVIRVLTQQCTPHTHTLAHKDPFSFSNAMTIYLHKYFQLQAAAT